MAIKVGSNFSYRGELFLDERQNIAKTKEDLKNWNILVPEGFETCLDGEWYYYSTREDSNLETGRFHKKISQLTDGSDGGVNSTLSQSVLSKILEETEKKVNDLDNSVFPLTIQVSGGKVLEKGLSIVPKISWTVKKKGEIVKPDKATVNDSEQYIDETKSNFNAVFPISNTTTYTVKAFYNSTEVKDSVLYDFRFKKYWGVSENRDITNDEILDFSSTFAYSGAMKETKFDCTGGKYPYYIIPKEYADNIDIWIGGLRNNDFTVTDKTITNLSGVSHEYSIVRLNNIQTGVLYIEFK